jgi:hypothetical protein
MHAQWLILAIVVFLSALAKHRAPRLVWPLIVGLLVATALAAPLVRWASLTGGGGVPLPIAAAVLALAWKYATRDFDVIAPSAVPLHPSPVPSATYLERIALLASAGLTLHYPVFLVPFVFQTCRFHNKGPHLHELMPWLVCAGAASLLAIRVPCAAAGLPPPGDSTLLLVLLLMVGHHYAAPGLFKLFAGRHRADWALRNPLHFILPSAHVWGWLNRVETEHVVTFTRRLQRAAVPLATLTLVGELGFIVMLAHPAIAIGLCLAMTAFHLGYFAMTGALFWEYIAVDLAMAWEIGTTPSPLLASTFNGPTAAAFALAMLVVPVILHAPRLDWWETRLTQRVYWQVKGRSGSLYTLSHSFMEPYSDYFYFGDYALVPYRRVLLNLCHTFWGRQHQPTAQRLNRDDGDRIVPALTGGGRVDPIKLQRHGEFLGRFFSAWNEGRRKRVLPRWLRWLQAPGNYLAAGGPGGPPFQGQEPVDEVRVRYLETFYGGAGIRVLRHELVHVLVIPAGSTGDRPTAGTPAALPAAAEKAC